LHHLFRRIRAILAISVTSLLLTLALLHVNGTDFDTFRLGPVLYTMPLIFTLFLLANIIATQSNHRLQMRPSRPLKGSPIVPPETHNGLFGPALYPLRPVKFTKVAKRDRLVSVVVSAFLALLGLSLLFHLYGDAPFSLSIPVWQFGSAIPLAGVLSLWWGRAFYTNRLRSMEGATKALKRVPRTAIYAIVSQAIVITGFSLILRAFGVDADFAILLAGASVTCFAASVPIGINGWGIREIAAMYIFGIVGISPGIAILASITLGLGLAMVSFLIPTIFQATPDETVECDTRSDPDPHSDVTRADAFSISVARTTTTASLVLWMGLLTAVLLFFQFQVTLGGSTITLNLADPFALGFFVSGVALTVFKVAAFRVADFRMNSMIRLPRLAWCWPGAGWQVSR
jgi:hypothetical protein